MRSRLVSSLLLPPPQNPSGLSLDFQQAFWDETSRACWCQSPPDRLPISQLQLWRRSDRLSLFFPPFALRTWGTAVDQILLGSWERSSLFASCRCWWVIRGTEWSALRSTCKTCQKASKQAHSPYYYYSLSFCPVVFRVSTVSFCSFWRLAIPSL